MAKPGVSEAARLRKLRAVLERAAQDCPPGTVLSSQPMAGLLGVSWATLREWCNDPAVDTAGAFIAGGNGIEWQFNPVATIWALIRHFERVHETKVEKNRRIREIATGDALHGVPEDFDLRDTREMVRLLTELRNRQQADGNLVDAAATVKAIRKMVSAIQSATLTSAAVLDPTGDWDPEFREAFDDAMSRALVLQGEAAAECLDALNAAGSIAKEPVRAR